MIVVVLVCCAFVSCVRPIFKLAAAGLDVRALVHQIVGIAAEPIDRMRRLCQIGRKETSSEIEAF